MNIKRESLFNFIFPHISLRRHILHYNIVFPEQNIFGENYVIMPDACGTISLASNGKGIKAELWGASVTPTFLGAEPNNYSVLLLIQVSPYGLYQITKQSQTELADKRIPLRDVDGELYNNLRNAFVTAKTVVELAAACDKVFFGRLEKQVVSDALFSATTIVSANNGVVQVTEIARQVGYSERHLNRLFTEQIGMNVKSYMRLVRFNYVLKNIQASSCFFAALSQQAGYFDQAHFDKDFKAISGTTPKDYLKNMSDFYYDSNEELATLL